VNTIGTVSCGIKALEGVLNNLVAAINRRTIDTGSGLTKHETESGILISLASAKSAQGDSSPNPAIGGGGSSNDAITPDGEAAGWHQITVVDDACNKLAMWVWGGTPGGNPNPTP